MSAHPTPTTIDREGVRRALRAGGTIDMTTHGRRTGQERRIEIVFFNFDGRVYITGLPGRRGWYANLSDDPRLTFHLKRGIVADLPARAIQISDEAERRAILARVTRAWKRESELDAYISDAPLIEVRFDDPGLLA